MRILTCSKLHTSYSKLFPLDMVCHLQLLAACEGKSLQLSFKEEIELLLPLL